MTKVARADMGFATRDSAGPLVSVIMNCYNGAEYLRAAIDSVLAQSYQNWEIVFWDNQSTDESASIFNSYSDSRLRYFLATEHTELGRARNQAVALSQGKWIGFLDCDDMWLPEKLEYQVDIIQKENPGLGLVYGQMLIVPTKLNGAASSWASGMRKYSRKTLLKSLPEGMIFEKLLAINFIPLLTAIMEKQAYLDVGGVSDHFRYSEDYELFLKLAAIRKVRAVQHVVALYRVHESNISVQGPEKFLNESIEIISKYFPNPAAILGLRKHHSYYAFSLIKGRQFLKGLQYLSTHGSWKDFWFFLRLKACRYPG